jgi:glycosyltransferase involved in cell wall biosynthesis
MTGALPTVLHLSTGAAFRGGERQVALLHAGLMKRGWQSVIAARGHGAFDGRGVDGVRFFPWRGEWDIAGLAGLLRLVRSVRPALLHCHDSHAFNHGSIVGALAHVPVVVTRRVWFVPRVSIFDKWKYKRCAAIIAISRIIADQCAPLAAARPIAVIHSAVEGAKGDLPRGDARNALGLPESAQVAAGVGHFTREKGMPLLLRAVDACVSAFPGMRFVFIGPMDARAREECSRRAAIIAPGTVPDAHRYYGAFDLYLSASRKEGLGTALLDAVIRDIPVVATDAGGTRDVFPEPWPLLDYRDADAFAAAAVRAAGNLAQARADARLAGVRARARFSMDTMVEQTERIYRAVIQQARERPV